MNNQSNPVNNINKEECIKILYSITSLLKGIEDYNIGIDFIIENNLFSTLHKDHRRKLINMCNKINNINADLKIIKNLYKTAKPLEKNIPIIDRG